MPSSSDFLQHHSSERVENINLCPISLGGIKIFSFVVSPLDFAIVGCHEPNVRTNKVWCQ